MYFIELNNNIMTFNLMFWLWRESPVEYTKKVYKEILVELYNIVSADISSDTIGINIKSHKTTVKSNSSTVKTDGKTTIKLNLIPNGNN